MIDHPLTPVASADALSVEVRRVGGLLLDDAIRFVTHAKSGTQEKRVHEARKRMKEVRSLLRLVRFGLVGDDADPVRGRENETLRFAADQLGEARDAAVMVETLDKLKGQFAEELAADAFVALRKELASRHRRFKASGDGFSCCADALHDLRGRVDSWRIDAGKKGRAWDAIAPGLRKIYADGRHDLETARDSGDAALWHDWRKRVKDLRYSLELLRAPSPKLIGGMCDAANDLGDHLGDDHDLAVLSASACNEPGLCDEATATVLEALATRRSKELRDMADAAARQVYAESDKAFVKRIGAYWKSASA